ncbi:hypothetical protein BS643_08105 [Pseudomonas protegens]|uniref:hypothetical protein n=1 Tax=Pseudomonas protegens TaxID=380021 RepID=UPI0008070EA8|nr:hypothetical protein [Pseudomonas protegens]OBZ24453.1 hypothetical protein BBH57_20110 [Pseudomonas protegens]OBZ27714.1 hypothetical protein BBH58_05390 [Pseudomonas protegens]OKK47417.1 hypothetical protein BS643_08105 [Pseudomonas protegens]OKK49584.1 hypothetical protein BS644_10795 [Pseudomonas protegens]OKK66637.1 hypothetical protein BS645_01175 [Pseudomonas protegens]
MDPTHTQALQQLRKLIPIGLRHAQALLARCANNPQQAAELYKAELLQVLVDKSGLPAEHAREQLHAAGYDLNRALHAIEEARFTLTQRILRKHHRDKGQALDLIAQAIETAEQLPRQYWLDFQRLEQLAPAPRSFMILHEWLAYEGWEGFDSALHFHLPQAIAQLRHLQLDTLADTLEQADQRQQQLRDALAESENSIDLAMRINQDPFFNRCQDHFNQQRPQLDERLYQWVEQHLEQFPA